MYLKRLLAFLCCFTLVFCLFPSSAFATGGNGNIDGGGGSMGHGTSSNFWNSGNDGVRITVVDASSGTAVSSPLDFSNRTQKTSLLHFGKVNKLQYLGGAGLSLQSGVAYSCIRPTQSMPTIVSSKGQSNIEAIKRYFCSEYACMMVAQAAGVDYERMIAGEYKLLIEPIAYFTHNGQYRHIMTPLRFIVDWNRLLPIHPPVISGIIVCGLDLKDCCGAIRQFHKVVHIS